VKKTDAKNSKPKSTRISTDGAPNPDGGGAPTAGPNGGADDVTADGRQVPQQVKSYALLDPDIKALYMNFYKATYSKSRLDIKTKELIAIAAALSTGCKGCLEGHLKKAKKHGATAADISETIAITLGVNAATIVDRSDIANANLGGLFEAERR
jgi:AhpD family alkylhydroperoxidase